LRGLPALREELTHWATSDIPRVPLGYEFFDRRTSGGIAPGEVAIMLARTSVGKTWFAINAVANNPEVPVMFFSLEMHGRYILQRLAAVYGDVGTEHIEATLRRRGNANVIDRTVEEFPLLQLADEPGLGLGDMSDELAEYEKTIGMRPVFVVIDYVELVRTFGMSQQENVDRVTWQLKNFAREEDVAVLALHQVKRGESKRGVQNQGHMPLTMTDARFGGEMAADYMLGMYRPAMDPNMEPMVRELREPEVRLQFLKTRSGGGIHPDGVYHHWDLRTGRISEVDWPQTAMEDL
jgi:replicative DNA helicase